MRTLNVRLAAILLAGTIIFGAAAFLVHAFQVDRNSRFFLDEARKAVEEAKQARKEVRESEEAVQKARTDARAARQKKEPTDSFAEAEELARRRVENRRGEEAKSWERAIKRYSNYVTLKPDDNKGLQEFSFLLADVGQDGMSFTRAYLMLEKLLRRKPEREDPNDDMPWAEARRKLVDVSIAIGRLPDAKEHLSILLQGEEDVDLLDQSLKALKANAPVGDLAEQLRGKLVLEEHVAQLDKELAEMKPNDKAAKLAEKLREQWGKQYAELWELWGRCQRGQGQEKDTKDENNKDVKGAVNSFARAISLCPTHVEAYPLLANSLRRANRAKEADLCMQKLVEANPKSLRARQLRAGYLRVFAGQDEKTLEQTLQASRSEIKKALELAPEDAVSLELAVQCALELKQSAMERRQRELMARPTGPDKEAQDRHTKEADRLKAEADRYDQEARGYAQVGVERHPENPNMYVAKADIELRAGKTLDGIRVLGTGVGATHKDRGILWKLGLLLSDLNPGPESQKIVKDLRDANVIGPEVTDSQQATLSIAKDLQEAKAAPALVGYLEARISFKQANWLAARVALERLRPDLIPYPGLLREAEYLIGQCYRQTPNPDREIEAYQRALDTDPSYVRARLALYQAYLRANKLPEAARELQTAASKLDPLFYHLEWIRLEIRRNLGLPPDRRDWDPANLRAEQLEKAKPNDLQILTVHAELLIAQEKLKEAQNLLLQASQQNPDQIELQVHLVSLAGRRASRDEKSSDPQAKAEAKDAWRQAEQYLQAAEKKFGDKVILRLVRAQWLVTRDGAKATPELGKLLENTGRFSPEECMQLWRGMLVYVAQTGDNELTRSLCRRIAQQDPKNLQVRTQLFEMALHDFDQATRKRDERAMEETLKVIGDGTRENPGILGEIERLEGKGSLWLYGQAVRLALLAGREQAKDTPEARAQADAYLAQAQTHLNQAASLRPTWTRIPLLAGRICERQNKPQEALKNYLRAIKELSERSPSAVLSACQLLFQFRRAPEALQLLSLCFPGDDPALTPELARMWAMLIMQSEGGDLAQAKKLAQKAVDDKTAKHSDYLWLSEVQRMLAGRAKNRPAATPAERKAADAEADLHLASAERSLRRALELNDRVPETWVALIQFLAGTDRIVKGEELLKQAVGKLPAKVLPLVQGQCAEALGRSRDARENYQKAITENPNDIVTVRIVADYCVRAGDQEKQAESLLKQLASGKLSDGTKVLDPDVIWARRQWAMLLKQRTYFADRERALALVEENLKVSPGSRPDLRLKVDFLVADPRKAKTREAIEALRNLMEIEQTALPEDTFLLARLYLADNNWPKFRQTILSLLTRNQYDARYLATYINGMLQHNEPLLEVERYLDRLEKSAGNQFVWFNLKADILIRQGKIDEALRLLNKFLGFPKEQVLPADPLERMRLVAMSLEQFAGRAAPRPNMEPSHFKEQAERSARFLQEAEKLYRAYVSQVATVRGRPRQEMALASFHARKARVKEALVPQRQDQKARQEEQNKVAQQCLQEALDVIQQSWSDVAPGDLAQTVALIMHDPRVAAEQLKQAERIVGEAQKKQYPPQVDRFPLLVAVADLFTVQERYEEAEAAYRQIVAEQPNNAIALNNLAVLLALRGKDLNEALDLINRAIAIRGPDPSMLDSLTSVYLARDENDKALAAIQEAIADTPTPVRLFHLARAYYQLDRKAEAAEALRKAEKDGPIRNQLEPPERPVYDKLMTELNP